jgi:hypothetical protein
MSKATNDKPLPARLPEVEAVGATKPTPARAWAGGDGGAVDARTTRAAPGAEGIEPDVSEVALEVDGEAWRVRVLGRSGRSDGRSPALLVLGFWSPGEPDRRHVREATVVARALADLSDARLREAFDTATPPPAPEGRKPFFDAAGGGRRGATRQES